MFFKNFQQRQAVGTRKEKIAFELNAKKLRGLATFPYRYLELAQKMPERTWRKNIRKWEFPLSVANIRYIYRMRPNLVDMSEEFREKFDKLVKFFTEQSKRRTVNNFENYDKFPFNAKMRDYQMDGLNAMASVFTPFLDVEMGLGKTLMAMYHMLNKHLHGHIDSVFVFCPVSIIDNWMDEIYKFCPKGMAINSYFLNYNNTKLKSHKTPTEGEFPFYFFGIDSIGKSEKIFDLAIKEILQKPRPVGMIVDECQFIKNPDAVRSERLVELGALSQHKIAMTGTPVAKNIADIYVPFKFLDEGVLGLSDYKSFVYRYCFWDNSSKKIIGMKNEAELASLIKPYVFSATKKEHLPQLPDNTYTDRRVDLTKAQKSHIQQIKIGLAELLEANEVKAKFKAMGSLIGIQQIIEGFTVIVEVDVITGDIKKVPQWITKPEDTPKIKECLKTIKDIGDKPIIIWFRFNESLRQMHRILQDVYGEGCSVKYHGETPTKERKINKQKFIEGQARFFLTNAQCAGTGLNGLTVASHAIFLQNTFNFTDRSQAEARLHRLGQPNPVLNIDILARNSLDMAMHYGRKSHGDLVDYLRETLFSGGKSALHEYGI